MRALAIGAAFTVVLLLVPGGHVVLVLLIPFALLALLVFRASWQPLPTNHRRHIDGERVTARAPALPGRPRRSPGRHL